MVRQDRWTIGKGLTGAKRRALMLVTALAICAGISHAGDIRVYPLLGIQPDGSFIVSTGQRVSPGAIAFTGRPIDMALHPTGTFVAILNQGTILLISPQGLLLGSHVGLRSGASFRGIVWSPDGKRLYVSVTAGYVQTLDFQPGSLRLGATIRVKPEGSRGNPRPGGIAITRDGSRLYVAVTDRNAVAEIDLKTNRWVREYPVQNLPFEVKLTEDEKTLIVSNWGGRQPTDADERAHSGNAVIVVDSRGAAASGTVCLITRNSGKTKVLQVGLHPTAIAVRHNRAYVTNSAGDSLTEIDLAAKRVLRTLPIRWGRMNLFGSMPCALAIQNNTAYICNGGDNAVCIMDLVTGKVHGFRPAGYFPLAIAIDKTHKRAYVLNTKGNGSVRRTLRGLAGNAHDDQGTVSIVDLSSNLKAATEQVALNNLWHRERAAPDPGLAVYHGEIHHVLYIIKENRSYDEVFGDLPQGNGDPRLCFLGENITPNHHAIARQFALFDNAYVSGTNSADGHQWCTQALANDYLEHFSSGYRTYSFDGSCAMTISGAGCLWDAALKKGRTIRDYGEFCDARLAVIKPKLDSWKDLWKDRTNGRPTIQVRAGTHLASLRPYIHPRVLCWPLLQSDQKRADLFIAEYNQLSRAKRVPNLMFLTLPCDHTEGFNPDYPRPECMVADNDLALGRIVEAVSKSPQWRHTCIFVIEDDAQFGRDHVDGHRTVYFALSPYTRRRFVDHELCSTISMVRTIELMLGIPPMNRFDALAIPLEECFTNTLDLTPYTAVPNRIALDQMNPPTRSLMGKELYWRKKSMALDWSAPDMADPQVLNKVIWHTVCGADTPYPEP